MKWFFTEGEAKFARRFIRKTEFVSALGRLSTAKKTRFCGRFRDGKLVLYRQRSWLFSLFSYTLYARVRTENGRKVLVGRFSRPKGIRAVWLLWSLMLIVTGAQLVLTETLFALLFLIPGALSLIPLFFCFPKTRAELIALIEESGATRKR